MLIALPISLFPANIKPRELKVVEEDDVLSNEVERRESVPVKLVEEEGDLVRNLKGILMMEGTH